ncbi:hypothetical protein L6452_34921 [Arctium lappa]|uniref:Uncharacterized protein n=1 Tax=Arctium lappa TaxID=4217 RepID=A0ACB8YK95_ARCLA|nr:hypothetical protein L6452_34921 [Arctium lappa]
MKRLASVKKEDQMLDEILKRSFGGKTYKEYVYSVLYDELMQLKGIAEELKRCIFNLVTCTMLLRKIFFVNANRDDTFSALWVGLLMELLEQIWSIIDVHGVVHKEDVIVQEGVNVNGGFVSVVDRNMVGSTSSKGQAPVIIELVENTCF